MQYFYLLKFFPTKIYTYKTYLVAVVNESLGVLFFVWMQSLTDISPPGVPMVMVSWNRDSTVVVECACTAMAATRKYYRCGYMTPAVRKNEMWIFVTGSGKRVLVTLSITSSPRTLELALVIIWAKVFVTSVYCYQVWCPDSASIRGILMLRHASIYGITICLT